MADSIVSQYFARHVGDEILKDARAHSGVTVGDEEKKLEAEATKLGLTGDAKDGFEKGITQWVGSKPDPKTDLADALMV